MPVPMGAHVEIIEPYTEGWKEPLDDEKRAEVLATLPCIKPRQVRVNGVDVGMIGKDGITVDIGNGGATTVTLILMAKSVEIKAE